MREIKLGMTIWLHSDADTGLPIDWECFDITGENIPVDLIEYLVSEESEADAHAFGDVEPENAYYVVVVYKYEPGCDVDQVPGYWYLDDVIGHLRLPNEEAPLYEKEPAALKGSE